MELQSDAGGYRDVAARIDRLTKVQAGELTLFRRFLYVVFFVQVGLLLIVLPWWPAFWEHNYFAHGLAAAADAS